MSTVPYAIRAFVVDIATGINTAQAGEIVKHAQTLLPLVGIDATSEVVPAPPIAPPTPEGTDAAYLCGVRAGIDQAADELLRQSRSTGGERTDYDSGWSGALSCAAVEVRKLVPVPPVGSGAANPPAPRPPTHEGNATVEYARMAEARMEAAEAKLAAAQAEAGRMRAALREIARMSPTYAAINAVGFARAALEPTT